MQLYKLMQKQQCSRAANRYFTFHPNDRTLTGEEMRAMVDTPEFNKMIKRLVSVSPQIDGTTKTLSR